MSSRALTVTLNYDQSKKFAIVLNTHAPKEAILRQARNKFRSKTLSLVFLRGGAHLKDGADLPDSITQVWISKGEPYSGPPIDLTRSTQPGEVRTIGEKSFIDHNAVNQLRLVGVLEGVHVAVGMPDLHPGSRFPIGCAIAAEGIYPALIGSDVGCGIALYRLSSSPRSVSNPSKLASLLRGLDEPWSGDVPAWLRKYGIERSSHFDANSLGTVGAGNHFAEICSVEKIADATVAESLRITEDCLYLIVHTGSRGLGASILSAQTTTESNPYIPPTSPELQEYLVEHDYAVRWAVANRDLVAHRIRQCIYWPSDTRKPMSSWSDDLEKIVEVTHNSVTRHALNVNGETRELWVHRKGAAPADKGVVPCPGSRGDFSWLLQPTGDGQINLQSLAHGAGRRHGRNALHAGTKIAKSSLTTTTLGSEVVCTDTDLLIEERPEAYKDIGGVVGDMEDQGLCKGVVVLRPVVTYKIREGGAARKPDRE
ncbi:tRNA-splicing ligase RtcB [Hypsizygus marmoreus]|uniref:3'-phosphate/5'-hydroxy nucleic acid ligase n=1 Tax=Hypsizygus marmoreus TaxID=39966 RepID=A0A369JN69_HYPMA|nr:tRNA-splicing ligase RtcB [Hypsizygus marmoreus]